ncbi:MAG: LacI family transcriptional regulator [Trebonia sp.]|nr:LacI family transcriptional regulator [Trebonia sp.]
MGRKVTSFDVARLAGVSQPTVSRALRNLPGTSPETRARVLSAASELAYIPSDLGRKLSAQSTIRIAVVSEELTIPYYPELVEPLRHELASYNYRTVLVTDTPTGPVGLEALADGSYDGVVLTTTGRSSRLPRDLTERGIPHVLVNRLLDEPESDAVGFDNAQGAALITELLALLGHKRIGSIQGPIETSTARERAEGLARSMRDSGLRVRRELTRRVSFTHDEGQSAALDLVGTAEPPTAIVCGNDVVAMGVLSAARSVGLRVPEDLTVIGFDDIRVAAWPLVNLTTVHCDLELMAKEAVDLLMQQIDGARVQPRVRKIPVALRLRGTHGPRLAPGSSG